MIAKQEFSGFMARLALSLPRFAPNVNDKALLGVWYEQIGQRLDSADLHAAYEQCVSTLDSFPSIRQVLQFAGKAPQTTEDKSRDIAERIWAALKKGWASSRNAEIIQRRVEYVGEIGEAVVRAGGGWQGLSENVMDEDATTWKAQWRGLAEVIIRRGPNPGDVGPSFDRLPGGAMDEIRRLAERCEVKGG